MVRLRTEPLTAAAWEPFGWLPVADTDPSDGTNTLKFEWADPHLNVIRHAYDEVEHTEYGALCDRMFRHITHTQALMPLNCDAIVAVAPSTIELRTSADLGAVRAFLLHPRDVLVLHRGTWHWGPFPLASEPVELLNVQGLRYVEDNDCVVLPDVLGTAIEVIA